MTVPNPMVDCLLCGYSAMFCNGACINAQTKSAHDPGVEQWRVRSLSQPPEPGARGRPQAERHNPMTDETGWRSLETAPETGEVIRLRGRWPSQATVIEIEGFYDSAGFTHGWVDSERMSTFYASEWQPLPPPPTPKEKA